jgi:hypothetical protein
MSNATRLPRTVPLWLAVICIAAAKVATPASAAAGSGIAIDQDDIAGVVTSARGPEAGVWVIAETTALPTKFRKIVVTDDQGRYLLPQLPASVTYKVWVRGYGLVDSEPVQSKPGKHLNLAAVLAPTPQAAAQYYPANYWFSLLEVPAKSDFPGTGADGNGLGQGMLSQDYWVNQIKVNCEVCHQLGSKATRELPSVYHGMSSVDAWNHRIQTGQDGAAMSAAFSELGRDRALKIFASWTDRIAAGEVPPAPPRPHGVERNLVLTLWDWGGPATFVHDELSTDKRNPTRNSNGLIYAVDWGNDAFLTLDPRTSQTTVGRVPVQDPTTPPAKPQEMPQPSPYWGNEIYWTDPANPNHMAMDSQERVWMSARFRKPENQPAFCATHPSAKLAPLARSFRQIEYYDPKTKTFKFVNTCFDTHHVNFAADKDETLYANGLRDGVVGWVKTRVLLETGDESAAQGWCKPYVDVNRDGKVDPNVDVAIPMAGVYSVVANDLDGSVWAAVPAPMPGRIVRIDPKTCVGEVYEPPFNNPAVAKNSYTPRGIDVDTNGLIWTALAGSGHLASFDRRKCRIMDGPEAVSGQHCPEGWTLYPAPGPRFKNVTDEIAADHHYYNFVDKYNTLGLGPNVPLANGTGSDSLRVLLPATGEWITLRVPYPMNFYQRGMDGRIDDPKAGWKGRGMYADYGENAVWHVEGGKGTTGALVKFQLRPDPLAR